MKKSFVFILIAVAVVAVLGFSIQSRRKSADAYFDGYIYLIEVSDGYNVGCKLYADRRCKECRLINFFDLCNSLDEYSDEVENPELLNIPDDIFADENTTVVHVHLMTGHAHALPIAHENHDKLIEIIENFKPHVLVKVEDGKEYKSFKKFNFKEISIDSLDSI